jgi:hypothetical protein
MTRLDPNRLHQLLHFYRDGQPCPEGFTLQEVLLWDDAEWESEHAFIQWLFPTIKPSMINPDAPLLDRHAIQLWAVEPVLRENLERAYERFLAYLGIRSTETGLAWGTPNSEVWGFGLNHNWLRITRVLDSLSTLGRRDLADALFAFLEREAVPRFGVHPETVRFWNEARLAHAVPEE